MQEIQGVNLAAIAAHNSQQEQADKMALRIAAIQLAVQWGQGNDGYVIDVARDILAFLSSD